MKQSWKNINNYRKAHFIIEFLLPLFCVVVLKQADEFGIYGFGAATIYNLIYVLFLRKKAGERIFESIANIVLIWSCWILFAVVSVLLCSFFFGYTDYGLLGVAPGITYYGFEAWCHSIKIIVMAPFGIINAIYIGVLCDQKVYL